MTISIIHESAQAGNRHPEIIWGAKAIADVLGKDERQAFHLLSKGMVPGQFKIGDRYGLSIPAFRRAVHGDAA